MRVCFLPTLLTSGEGVVNFNTLLVPSLKMAWYRLGLSQGEKPGQD